MAKAFCPGHITCFFQPSGATGADVLGRGSRGAGVRITLGSEVTLEERSDDKVKVVIDGEETSAPVTESVMCQMLPGRGFDVIVENGVPCGEGFGMSAAGAIAAALCAAFVTGDGMPSVYRAAHRADIAGGGGLGDVSALTCLEHQPVRVEPGLPPRGRVVGTGISFEHLTLAVLGPKLNTGLTLGDEKVHSAITEAGAEALKEFMEAPSVDSLFSISNSFSARSMVESQQVKKAISDLRSAGIRSAMCMLGNSIFADAPEGEVADVLGDVRLYSCASTDAAPRIIRKE